MMSARACAAAIAAVAVLAGCGNDFRPVRFADVRVVSAPTQVGTAPMFAVSAAGTEAVAWVSAPQGGTDGRLYISVRGAAPTELQDPLGPVEAHGESPPKLMYGADGSLNAVYVVPKVVPGEQWPLGALRFIRSTDGGATWSAPVSVTDDAVFGAHNFHALHAALDGGLYVSWLDSREGWKSGVYLTRSEDGGRTWTKNVRVASGEACPCCRTAVTTGRDGTLFVAWRSVAPGDVRDIVVARSDDRGATFGEPVAIHGEGWMFPGCPHAGPSIQVDAANRLHVAWWTGKEGIAGVHYARSDDGGRTFGAYQPLGIAQFSRPAHVQMVLGAKGEVLVAWDDGTRETPQVVLRVSRDGGRTFGPAEPVSDAAHAAMFPVLAVAGSTVTVAWSEEGAEYHQAKETADSIRWATNPHAPVGLHPVGRVRVVARRGTVS